MKHSTLTLSFLALAVAFAATGCSSTKTSSSWNGLGTPDGTPVAHVSTSNMALHFLFGRDPIVGNASLDQTVNDYTAAVKATGASKTRIVQSSSRAWWFVFPPFSFFVTPVTSNVAGDAIQ